nr:phosphotransferase [Paenibacillus sp. ACRRX]
MVANGQHLFTEEQLQLSAQRLGIEVDRLYPIGGFENIIYGFEQGGRDLILRISHSAHRSAAQIESELDWVHFLAEQGVRVVCPMPFSSGQFIERLEAEEGYFTLAVFEKAEGSHVNASHELWGPHLFELWGEITGDMHAKTVGYRVAEGLESRPHQDDLGLAVDRFSDVEHELYHKLSEVSAAIDALPRVTDHYGLCHRDLHQSNFFVDSSGITAFDFDDCGYDYFLQDIAIAVFYGSVFGNKQQIEYEEARVSTAANEVFRHFMTGYNRKYQLDKKWLVHLPLFIEKRRVELTLLLYTIWGSQAVDENKRAWLAHNVDGIRNGIPCMQLLL